MTDHLQRPTPNEHALWSKFLDSDAFQSEEQREAAIKAWVKLSAEIVDPPLPVAQELSNYLYFTWSNQRYTLELSVDIVGVYGYFYRDRQNGDVWGKDAQLEIPAVIHEQLPLLMDPKQ